MSVEAIARPYAKAVFMLATEQKTVEDWASCLAIFAQLSQDAVTQEVLKNPVYSKQCRFDFFYKSIKEVMPTLPMLPSVSAFLSVLNELDRMILLPEIARTFEDIRSMAQQSKKAKVISAKPLTAEEQAKLVEALSQRFSSAIELDVKEDSNLVAGLIVQVEDVTLDGSVHGKIRQVREALA